MLEQLGRAALQGALDLCLPIVCLSCERALDAGEPGIVCGRCWSRLVLLPHPQCARCGHPRDEGTCRWCDLLPPFVRAARSVCWVPGGVAGDTVHALKYDGWMRVADAMGERMARLAWPRDVTEERAALVPVPLARTRQRERGYNQSDLLADAVARRWRIPVVPGLLARARETTTQTRLTPEQRLRNVSGAFRVNSEALSAWRGMHLVLVDDVVTTSATLNACAAALVSAGARIVSYVTFGRARATGDR